MEIPDTFEEHCPGNNAIGVTRQVFEDLEFPGLQFNPFAGPCYRSLEQINFKVSNLQHGGHLVRRRPARQCIHPSQELGECEGLNQIVVGSGF